MSDKWVNENAGERIFGGKPNYKERRKGDRRQTPLTLTDLEEALLDLVTEFPPDGLVAGELELLLLHGKKDEAVEYIKSFLTEE